MNEIISHNLKKLRETAGYTQDQVAQALGVRRSAYSNYESGDREMPYDIMEKASDFYGCDMSLFFDESDISKAQILATAFRLDDIEVLRTS